MVTSDSELLLPTTPEEAGTVMVTVPADSVTWTVLVTITSEPAPAPALLLLIVPEEAGTVIVTVPALFVTRTVDVTSVSLPPPPFSPPIGAARGAKTLAASSGS